MEIDFIHQLIESDFLDLIIRRLVTNETSKICCLGLILALSYSTMVIKNDLDNNRSCNKLFSIVWLKNVRVRINKIGYTIILGELLMIFLLKVPKITKMGAWVSC